MLRVPTFSTILPDTLSSYFSLTLNVPTSCLSWSRKRVTGTPADSATFRNSLSTSKQGHPLIILSLLFFLLFLRLHHSFRSFLCSAATSDTLSIDAPPLRFELPGRPGEESIKNGNDGEIKALASIAIPAETGISVTTVSHNQTEKDVRNRDVTGEKDGASSYTVAAELPGVERNPPEPQRTLSDLHASGIGTDEGLVGQIVEQEKADVVNVPTGQQGEARQVLTTSTRSTGRQPRESGGETEGGRASHWHESEKSRDLQSQEQPYKNIVDEGASATRPFREEIEARDTHHDNVEVQEVWMDQSLESTPTPARSPRPDRPLSTVAVGPGSSALPASSSLSHSYFNPVVPAAERLGESLSDSGSHAFSPPSLSLDPSPPPRESSVPGFPPLSISPSSPSSSSFLAIPLEAVGLLPPHQRLVFIETARRLPPELHAMLLAEIVLANAESSSRDLGFPSSTAVAATREEIHGPSTALGREPPSPRSSGQSRAERANPVSSVESEDPDHLVEERGAAAISPRNSVSARHAPLPSSSTPPYAFHVGAASPPPTMPFSSSSFSPSSGSRPSAGVVAASGVFDVSRQTEVPSLERAYPDPSENRRGQGSFPGPQRLSGGVTYVSPGISSSYASELPSLYPPSPSWSSAPVPPSYVQQHVVGNPARIPPSPRSLPAYYGSTPFSSYSSPYSYPHSQPYSPAYSSSLPLSVVLAAAPAPPPVLAETVNAAVGTAVNQAASLVDNTLRSAIVSIVNPATYNAASMLHGLQALNDKVYAGSEVATRAFLDFAAYRRTHPDDTLAQLVNSLEEATDTLNVAATAGTPRLKPTIDAQKQRNQSISQTEDLLLEGMGLFSPTTEHANNLQTQSNPSSVEGRKGNIAFERSSPKKILSRTDGPAGNGKASGRRENETSSSSAKGTDTFSAVGNNKHEVVPNVAGGESLPQEIIDLRTLLTKEQTEVLEGLTQVLNLGFDAALNFVKNQGRNVPGLKQFPFFQPLQQKVMNMYYRASANRDAEKQVLEQEEKQEAERKAMKAGAEREQQFWAEMQKEALRNGLDPRVVVAHMLQTALQNTQTSVRNDVANSPGSFPTNSRTNTVASQARGVHAARYPLRSVVGTGSNLHGKRGRFLASMPPRLLARKHPMSSRSHLGSPKEISEGKAENETSGETRRGVENELPNRKEPRGGPMEGVEAKHKENKAHLAEPTDDTKAELPLRTSVTSFPTAGKVGDHSEERVQSFELASTDNRVSDVYKGEKEESELMHTQDESPLWEGTFRGENFSPRHLASTPPFPVSGLQNFSFSSPASLNHVSSPSAFALPPIISLPSSAGVSVAPTALDQLLSLMGVPENCLLENFRYRGLANVVDRRSSLSTCQAVCRAAAATMSSRTALTDAEMDFAAVKNPQKTKRSPTSQTPPCGFISFLPEVELCYRYATVEGLLPAPGYVSAPISCSIVETGQYGRQDEKRAAEALLMSGFQAGEQVRDRETPQETKGGEERSRPMEGSSQVTQSPQRLRSSSASGEVISSQRENSAKHAYREEGFDLDGRIPGNDEDLDLAFRDSGPLSRASSVSPETEETSLVSSSPSTPQTHFFSPSLAKHQAAEEALLRLAVQVRNQTSSAASPEPWDPAMNTGMPKSDLQVASSPSFSPPPSVSPSMPQGFPFSPAVSSRPYPPPSSSFSFLAPSPEMTTQEPTSPVPSHTTSVAQPFASPQNPSVWRQLPPLSPASSSNPFPMSNPDVSPASLSHSLSGFGLNSPPYPPSSTAMMPTSANSSVSASYGPFLTGAAAPLQSGGFLPPSYSPRSFSPQSVPSVLAPGYSSAPSLTAFSALAPLPTITTPVATTAGSLLQTTQGLMQAGNALMQAFPLQQLLDAGQQLYASGFFRNRGMKHLQIPMLGPQKQELPPPPGMEKPTVNCASEGMTCCVPENAAEKWKERPPYLNNNEKQKKCRAHFVSMLNSLCATTSYALKGDSIREKYASGLSSASLAEDEEDNCGLVLTETRDFWIFHHTLVIPGRTMNNAICECKEPKKANEEGLRQIEAFSTWEFSLQAVHAMEQQAERGEQIAKGLGTALALTTMLGQQGEEAIGHVLEHASTRGVRK